MSRRKDFIDSLLDGASRLHRAAATKTEHQVRDLIHQGADPNLRNWRGETPLHRAAIRNPDLDVSRALIGAGADVNAQDESGATPLHRAAPNASPARGNLLIEAGASVDVRDKSGAAPLHYAAESGRDRMMVRLIEAGADLNSQDQAGRTPLRIAVEKGWPESTKTLLAHGADPNVPDNEGRIPLHSAYGAERQDMVNRLLEAGANLEARDATGCVPIQHLHDPDDDGGRGEHEQEARANDPSHIRNKETLPHELRTDRQEYERIQNAVNPADSEGRTPLHRAAEEGSPLGVHRLLEEGADPNVRDNAGRTPLDVAMDRRDRLDPSLRNDGAVRILERATVPQQDNTPDRGRPMRGKTSTEEYYKQFADDIITQVERGTAPWQKHWKPGENRMPENFRTGARYQGGNALQLMVKRTGRAWNDHRWGTYNQIKEAGGQVRKGERGTTVLVYKPRKQADGKEATPGERTEGTRDDPDAGKTTRPMWKRYTVFNVEQAEGLELPDRAAATPQWEAQQNVEKVIRANGARIREVNGDRAYYNMPRDEIVLPERSQFKNAEGYYQTALHEVGHSTGHPDRLNRESLHQGIKDGFGSEAYAREELRAEISAMMSSDRLGVAYEPQHGTAYVKGWVEVLKDDPKEIHKAAAEAGRISDYVCEAPERARAKAIGEARDAPTATGEEPNRGRTMPEPVVAHQPQPAVQAPAKAPEIELSR